jgi:hypothetical protein
MNFRGDLEDSPEPEDTTPGPFPPDVDIDPEPQLPEFPTACMAPWSRRVPVRER